MYKLAIEESTNVALNAAKAAILFWDFVENQYHSSYWHIIGAHEVSWWYLENSSLYSMYKDLAHAWRLTPHAWRELTYNYMSPSGGHNNKRDISRFVQ